MNKVVIELPHWQENMGGLRRMLRLVMELPFYRKTSGGVIESVKMAENIEDFGDFEVQIRFQKMIDTPPEIGVPWTVGLPDSTFPVCDIAITYSDTPYADELANLPQVDKKFAMMLSYGMAIHRERKVATHPNIKCMSSTRRTQTLIKLDKGKAHWVGFGFDKDLWGDNIAIERKRYCALLYHPSADKRYLEGVVVANRLCEEGMIDGVITFGSPVNYANAVKPSKLVRHVESATQAQVRDIFSECMIYVMPSCTEGLNLTPIESTLCGCPAVLCDGAIGEIFFNGTTCMVADEHPSSLMYMTKKLIKGDYATMFQKNMQTIMKDYTWKNTVKRIVKYITKEE